MNRPVRGFAVAPLMVLGMVCLVLTLTVAAIATFQLNSTHQSQNSEQALYLAEGALTMAMARIHNGLEPGNTPYGRANEVVTFTPYPDPGAVGTVSFVGNSSVAGNQQPPDGPSPTWGYSTNNYDGSENLGWNGIGVPQGTAYVVAEGVSGNAVRIVEAFLNVPQYSYVLSSDGAIQTPGASLVVRAESSMQAFATNTQNHTPNWTTGANVGSNTSITAGANSTVTGDVVCEDVGNIDLQNPSTVDGVERAGSITLPTQLGVTAFDNSLAPNIGSLPASNAQNLVSISQNTYASGTPVTVNGDLQLDDCTLYVEGGLTITGGLEGTGAVIVHGDVNIGTGANLNAGNLVALVASGNVSLNGPVGTTKYFQGLVYTEGNFTTSNITIAGAFVAAAGLDSPAGSTGSITLGPGTQVVYVPAAANINGLTATSLNNLGITFRMYSFPQPGMTGGTSPGTTIIQPPNGGWYPEEIQSPPSGGNQVLYDATQAATAPILNVGGMGGGVGIGKSSFELQPSLCCGVGQGDPLVLSTQIEANYYDPVSGQFVALTPPNVVFWLWDPAGLRSPQPISQAQYDADAAAHGQPSSATVINAAVVQANAFSAMANAMMYPTPYSTTSATASIPSLGLNNFLSDKSPLQIVSWRER